MPIPKRVKLSESKRLLIYPPDRNYYLSDRVKKTILKDIDEIEPKIHRLILSGPYNYDQLSDFFGRFPYQDAGRRMPNYAKMGYTRIGKTPLTIFFNPINYRPPCRIELTYNSLQSLLLLNTNLPELDIASVEYATDFYCPNPDRVADLFFVFWLYMFFPRYSQIKYMGGDFKGLWEEREENVVYKVGPVNKIYERGPDKKRSGLKWNHEDVNRVRVEFTLRKPHLAKYNIMNFSDLIESPQITEMAYERFAFKAFEGSKGLPLEFEKAILKDEAGNLEPVNFQELVAIANRTKFVNPRLYFREAPGFESLKGDIKSAMENYDRKWRLRYKRIKNKMLADNRPSNKTQPLRKKERG